MSEILIATFAIYLFVMIGIGVYFFLTTPMKRLSEYMLADRNVRLAPMAISEAASVASGWTFFAWVGIGFALGLNGLWFALATLVMALFVYRVIGSRFRRQSEALDSLTIADHLSLFYRNNTISVLIRVVTTVAIVVFYASYAGAQFIAVGESAQTGLGIDYTAAVVVGGIAVAIYTGMGGFNASIWTDVVQGILIMAAALIIPIAAIMEVGGWSSFVAEVNAVDPGLLTLSGPLAGTELILMILVWLTFSLFIIGQPHSLMRFQSIQSERLISGAAVIAMLFQALRMTLPLFVGIAGRVLYEDIGDPETVAIVAIVDLLPAVIAGILLAGIVSAIISTTDSMILVASSDLTKAYERFVNPDASERFLVLLGRGVVVALSLGGIVLAMWRPGTIFDIVLFAAVGLGVTFGVPLLFILLWEKTTGWGVLACIFVGLAGSIVDAFYLYPDYFPILVWPVSFATIVVVSLLTESGGTTIDYNPEPAD